MTELIGEFKNEFLNGLGFAWHQNGLFYMGPFKNGSKHGLGFTFNYSYSSYNIEEWQDGILKGFRVEYNQTIYTGYSIISK